MQERPRRCFASRCNRNFNERRAITGKRAFEHGFQFKRRRRAVACRAETFREFDEIRIAQTISDVTAFKYRCLIAHHVAKTSIVKHNRNQIDPVLHGAGEFLHPEHEATVAADGHDRFVRVRYFDAQRAHESESKIVLVTAGDVAARMVNREAEARGKSCLVDFLDEESIAWQHTANDIEITELRLHDFEFLARLSLDRVELRRARSASADPT